MRSTLSIGRARRFALKVSLIVGVSVHEYLAKSGLRRYLDPFIHLMNAQGSPTFSTRPDRPLYQTWPHRLAWSRTLGSHPRNWGSNPHGVITALCMEVHDAVSLGTGATCASSYGFDCATMRSGSALCCAALSVSFCSGCSPAAWAKALSAWNLPLEPLVCCLRRLGVGVFFDSEAAVRRSPG